MERYNRSSCLTIPWFCCVIVFSCTTGVYLPLVELRLVYMSITIIINISVYIPPYLVCSIYNYHYYDYTGMFVEHSQWVFPREYAQVFVSVVSECYSCTVKYRMHTSN